MRCLIARFVCIFTIFPVLNGAPQEASHKPKVVVAIIVDQFRYDYLLRFQSDYNSGFARLLRDGAVFADAHYLQAATVTAVGHSTFMTGATPSVSGIIANEWYDRQSGRTITSVFDAQTKLVGGIPDRPGSSPRRLEVSALGDEIKAHDNAAKVISISIKDRSAVLPGGHRADGAYWYDGDSNTWVTSTYYREALPPWAEKANEEKWYQRYLGKQWFPFDAKDESGKPFCSMVAGGEVNYCGSLEATPWGNEMIEEFAERAIEGENIGGHAGTDLLAVSFSSNDYVGHAVGPDDPAVRDISIRTDRLLGKFLDAVERRVGAGNMLVVLTADHGVAPVPEVSQALKMPGGRLSDFQLLSKMKGALVKRFGPGEWLLPSPTTMQYLNLPLIHTKKLDPAEVERVAAEAARSEPHIARVMTRSELEQGQVQEDNIGRAFTLGFFGPRSGDVFILQDPYYLFEATGTSHGTPYGYDNHVPVIFLGPQIKGGHYLEHIIVNDIAPTLAAILGTDTPTGSCGRVLTEILR